MDDPNPPHKMFLLTFLLIIVSIMWQIGHKLAHKTFCTNGQIRRRHRPLGVVKSVSIMNVQISFSTCERMK